MRDRLPWRPVAAVVAMLLVAVANALNADAPGGTAASELQSAFGSPEMVSLATGYKERLVEVPATATIVERAWIDSLAVRSLADILNHVAGFRIVPSPDGRGSVIVERGRQRQVLFMVDGIPYIKGLIFGWQNLEDVLPYDIERIEVVRGPASAAYGANASGGVVNVITRSSTGLTGLEAGGRAGSFASNDGWLRAGTGWPYGTLNAYVGIRSTDQTHAVITRDAATTLDEIYGTHTSLAPGPLAGHRNVLEARGNVQAGPWKLTVARFAETDFHTGAGIAQALDPSGLYDNRMDSADLALQTPVRGSWELSGFASYSRVIQTAHTTLYPPGAFDGAFPAGVLYGLAAHEDRQQLELSAVRRALEGHDVRIGVGELDQRFALDQDERNFIIRRNRLVATGYFGPGAGVGDPVTIAPTRLQATYAFAQDEWILAPDWRLTTGLRWDRYQSFGTTLNPRVGLVWLASSTLNVKVLYGSAFAPPGLTETSSNGLFGGLGNRTLRPERSRTFSLSTSLERPTLRAELTTYYYHDTSLIQLLPSASSVNGLEFFNAGAARGWGLESSVHYDALAGYQLSASYAFHQFISHDQDADQGRALAAKHQLTLEASIPLLAGWTLQMNSQSVVGRERPVGDPRPDPANYTLLGSQLVWRSPSDRLTVRAGARNVLNSDAREADSSTRGIYYDLPLPGRELFTSFELHR
jgi:outer membrane receptor for ferrienterochelin and colicins